MNISRVSTTSVAHQSHDVRAQMPQSYCRAGRVAHPTSCDQSFNVLVYLFRHGDRGRRRRQLTLRLGRFRTRKLSERIGHGMISATVVVKSTGVSVVVVFVSVSVFAAAQGPAAWP